MSQEKNQNTNLVHQVNLITQNWENCFEELEDINNQMWELMLIAMNSELSDDYNLRDANITFLDGIRKHLLLYQQLDRMLKEVILVDVPRRVGEQRN